MLEATLPLPEILMGPLLWSSWAPLGSVRAQASGFRTVFKAKTLRIIFLVGNPFFFFLDEHSDLLLFVVLPELEAEEEEKWLWWLLLPEEDTTTD